MTIHDFDSEGSGKPDFVSKTEDTRTDVQQEQSPMSVDLGISNDVKTARTEADEMINISGAFVTVYPRMENNVDVIWDEDPDPVYGNGFRIKAFFKPQPIKIELRKWGVDTSSDTTLIFSHRQLFERLGERMLRSGDIIKVRYNAAQINPEHYEITNGQPTGQYKYQWLYFSCQATISEPDQTTRVKDDIFDIPEDDEGYFIESY